jgi:hypothetical protein
MNAVPAMPPRADAYPAFAHPAFTRSIEDRRRWDLSVARAEALFPEVGGPHVRFYAALALYDSEMATDEEPT